MLGEGRGRQRSSRTPISGRVGGTGITGGGAERDAGTERKGRAERGRGSEGKKEAEREGGAELEAGTQSLDGTDLEGGAEL